MKKHVLIIFVFSFVAAGCSENEDYGVMCDIGLAAKEITNDINEDSNPQYYHTLIDVNNDRIEELIIEYYGLAGTGLKYRMDVYHLDESLCKYILNKEISNLANITFDSNFIYGFYIANGGGEANKYEWEGNNVKLIEKYTVDIMSDNADSISVEYSNFITGKKESFFWNKIDLPKEYNYNNYKPILIE